MAKNLNLALPRLRTLAKASEQEPSPSTDKAAIYSFVVASTVLDGEGRLRQRGSGPNFSGGVITLTTCKHRMRASMDSQAWRGRWIAGLSSAQNHDGRQALLFLMQVERAFESHAELVEALPDVVRQAKSARRHIHGDVFEPLRALTEDEAFDVANYHPPLPGHRHERPEQWHRDIHDSKWERPAALLVGDPKRSFLWTEPMLFYRGQLTQGYKKWCGLTEFLNHLATDDRAVMR